jgi:hypothetical protein
MRHEILRDAVVGVIQKDFQFEGPLASLVLAVSSLP